MSRPPMRNAAGRPAEPGEDADQRGFACAVGPEDHQRFAHGDAQIDPAQHHFAPESLGQLAQLDHRRGLTGLSRRSVTHSYALA